MPYLWLGRCNVIKMSICPALSYKNNVILGKVLIKLFWNPTSCFENLYGRVKSQEEPQDSWQENKVAARSCCARHQDLWEGRSPAGSAVWPQGEKIRRTEHNRKAGNRSTGPWKLKVCLGSLHKEALVWLINSSLASSMPSLPLTLTLDYLGFALFVSSTNMSHWGCLLFPLFASPNTISSTH